MPRSLRESVLFTCIMCSLMVLGMSTYNLLINGVFSWSHLFLGFIPGFIVAFILDWYIVGPAAKKVAFKILASRDIKHKIATILAISTCMILGMVTCMSLYGLLFNVGLAGLSLQAYLTAWGLNFIAALPLQLLIVGPISRAILVRYQAYEDRRGPDGHGI